VRLPQNLAGSDHAVAAAADERMTLPLHAEEVTVMKRVRRTLVRAATTTLAREEIVEADLEHVQIVVDRFVIGRVVEGDVTIMSVVEEELVVVRRLVLKEEVHIRTVRTVSRHAEPVTLRSQDIVITRTELED
jgi:stress response protein YsnF